MQASKYSIRIFHHLKFLKLTFPAVFSGTFGTYSATVGEIDLIAARAYVDASTVVKVPVQLLTFFAFDAKPTVNLNEVMGA